MKDETRKMKDVGTYEAVIQALDALGLEKEAPYSPSDGKKYLAGYKSKSFDMRVSKDSYVNIHTLEGTYIKTLEYIQFLQNIKKYVG